MTSTFNTAHWLTTPVAQIVTEQHRAADVFRQLGINYCCSGNIPLQEVCTHKGLRTSEVLDQLAAVCRPVLLPPNTAYNKWSLHFLADYIIHIHHGFLKTTLPQLEASLQRFAAGHVKKWPQGGQIVQSFQQLHQIAQVQMLHEESSLFPYIKQMERAQQGNEAYGRLLVKTLRKPLHEENNAALETALMALRELTTHYTVGAKACTNHTVLFRQLQELDDDLVQHKHLENNILFPRAAAIERQLMGTTEVQ